MGISFEHPLTLLALLLPAAWVGCSYYKKKRPNAFTWMRVIIVLLLVLALAGTGITYSARHQAVMFVADLSTSTVSTRNQMEQFIKQAIGQIPAGDVAGVLAIGEDAQLEAPVAPRPTFPGFTAVIRPDHTDLERGLRLGAALLPSGYRPRLVLLSDGKENVGNAMAEVQRLRQRGYTVDVVNLSPDPGAEAMIKSIEAPGALRLGERLEANITLTATQSMPATLRIYEEQRLLETRQIDLKAGDQQVRVQMEGLKSGYHRIWATLEPAQDTLTQNNQSAVMVNVQGAPSILLVEGFPGGGTNLRRALEATGMTVEVRSPDAMPTHGPQFARYASTVLVDVPASFLRADSLQALASSVRQSGHGLVVVGGEHSYGMGGYAGTELEELLPVTMDIPQRKEQPPIAVALVIENFESNQKVNISKEAGKGIVDLLTERDYILVGDATVPGMWAVQPQKVTDKAAIKDQIDAMSPGDPPHYMEHLEAAAKELAKLDAKVKHIVFAGDGDAQMISFGEYARRVAAIAEQGITLSTVHVNWLNPGEEVLMQLMAQQGKGRYYLAADAATTPQIFMKEAQTMARPAVIEEDFVPGVLSRNPMLQGINALPALRGYVGTTPRPTGEVVLQSAQADPILATWQAGLGRVVAYTSDSGGLWSEAWVPWQGFTQFWSNVVSYTMPDVDASGLRTQASVVGGQAHLTVQVPGEGITIGSNTTWPANITAGIIRPDGSTQVMQLGATAPGQYEGEIPASIPGPYLVKLSAGDKRQSTTLGETFIVVPYSPEFATSGADPGFMQRLAKAGGGQELTEALQAFARNLPPAPGRLPLDQALLLAALLLWPLDIALRRLSVTPAEAREWWRRRKERQLQQGAATAAGAALGKLRERRAEKPLSGVKPAAANPAEPKPATQQQQPAAGPEQKPAAEPKPEAKREEGGGFTDRLLAARRKKQ